VWSISSDRAILRQEYLMYRWKKGGEEVKEITKDGVVK